MTRKEAKAWLKVLLKDEYAFNSTDREAFAVAIKALEQEPCDTCEAGNPCLYCKHEFEPQESEDKE